MNSQTVFQQLCQVGILPVIRSDDRQEAITAARALAQGGIPVAEVTLTVPDALEVIEHLKVRQGDRLTIGAGTVTDAATCNDAIAAGCHFVVTPVVDTDVIDLCRRKGVCIIGGALTPTEIMTTHRAGADAVKVFPAKAMGGPAYLRMLREPFPDIPLVPTGGVNLETIGAYFSAGAVLVGAGGDLVRQEALRRRKPEQVTTRARQYVAAIHKARENNAR